MRIVTSDLVREVLMRPASVDEADELLIVSGYATAGMVEEHVEALKKGVAEGRIAKLPTISLVMGMVRLGIEAVQHRGLCRLVEEFDMFSCYYVIKEPPCHAKIFVWKRKGNPIRAFVGSANYTVAGFGRSQREAVAEANPVAALDYHSALMRHSVSCTSSNIETLIPVMQTRSPNDFPDGDAVVLPLVQMKGKNRGKTHNRGGLNWGQRGRRNRDEAYIPIPKAVRDRDFFPPIGERFTALTDDNQALILVVAQQGGKALHTTMDNSELGKYFRTRLGVPLGQPVKSDHLIKYGRRDVAFYRIDPETYQMDFQPNLSPGEDLERWET